MKKPSKLIGTAIVGAIAAVFAILVSSLISPMLFSYIVLRLGMPTTVYALVIAVFGLISKTAAMIIGAVIYTKAIAKIRLGFGAALSAGIFFYLAQNIVNTIFQSMGMPILGVFSYVLTFVFAFLFAFVYLAMRRDKKENFNPYSVPYGGKYQPNQNQVYGQPYAQPYGGQYQPQYQQNPQAYTQPYGQQYQPYQQNAQPYGQQYQPYAQPYQQPAQQVPQQEAPVQPQEEPQSYARPEPQPQYQAPQYQAPQYQAPERIDMDSLSVAILNAIRPTLKAPLTAVLCEKEQMVVTNNNGIFEISGFVNSQNSYGAMIATDFTVKARYENGMWYILNTAVGVKNAKNYAKNFAVNYIIISIFVAVMGLLGYFILTMLIG